MAPLSVSGYIVFAVAMVNLLYWGVCVSVKYVFTLLIKRCQQIFYYFYFFLPVVFLTVPNRKEMSMGAKVVNFYKYKELPESKRNALEFVNKLKSAGITDNSLTAASLELATIREIIKTRLL
jgi:hypothetical protein